MIIDTKRRAVMNVENWIGSDNDDGEDDDDDDESLPMQCSMQCFSPSLSLLFSFSLSSSFLLSLLWFHRVDDGRDDEDNSILHRIDDDDDNDEYDEGNDDGNIIDSPLLVMVVRG